VITVSGVCCYLYCAGEVQLLIWGCSHAKHKTGGEPRANTNPAAAPSSHITCSFHPRPSLHLSPEVGSMVLTVGARRHLLPILVEASVCGVKFLSLFQGILFPSGALWDLSLTLNSSHLLLFSGLQWNEGTGLFWPWVLSLTKILWLYDYTWELRMPPSCGLCFPVLCSESCESYV
jgi:hypothetical protein